MEALVNADEIIEAAETRLAEIGAEIGKRMIAGKNSADLLRYGQRLLTAKNAYHVDLDDKEKEALLYCMRKLSEKFDVPALTQINVFGPFIPPSESEEPFVDFYIGTLTDVDGYIGTAADAENFIGQ